VDSFLLAADFVSLTGGDHCVRRDLLLSYATLTFEATRFPQKLVYTYQIIRRHIQGAYNFWISSVINFISKDLVNANNNNLTTMAALTTKIFKEL
jgi:hypothetical protein